MIFISSISPQDTGFSRVRDYAMDPRSPEYVSYIDSSNNSNIDSNNNNNSNSSSSMGHAMSSDRFEGVEQLTPVDINAWGRGSNGGWEDDGDDDLGEYDVSTSIYNLSIYFIIVYVLYVFI